MFLTYRILKNLFKSIKSFFFIFQEKRKAEEALSDLRRQYETEVGDLQVTIKKLKKVGMWQLDFEGYFQYLNASTFLATKNTQNHIEAVDRSDFRIKLDSFARILFKGP